MPIIALGTPELPDADFVLNALLRQNYLPMTKKRREELPPTFSSSTFLPKVAKLLNDRKARTIDCDERKHQSIGYDAVEYRLTRFNGIPRLLSIPHPLAYAQLCCCIHEHWDSLQSVARSEVSRIIPRRHADERLIIMDYEMGIDKNCRKTANSIGARYVVTTDIANFFPSIYSHAVGWVLLTPERAKIDRSIDEDHWPNILDLKLRQCKRGETQGVAIGPATSNLIAELILDDVDQKMMLSERHWKFERFLDDYTAYCASEDEGRDFVRCLGDELSRFNLLLNARKTTIEALPRSFAPEWTTRLMGLPTGEPGSSDNEVDRFAAIRYLDLAMSLAQDEPDESVLKYALKTLFSHSLSSRVQTDVLPYVLGLCFHQPALLPTLGRLLAQMPRTVLPAYQTQLNELVCDNAICHRSDGMCWALYYMTELGVSINEMSAQSITGSGDCFGLILLYLSGVAAHRDAVSQFANDLIQKSPNDLAKRLYGLDRYWLLLYKLYLDGMIGNPYPGDDTFDILKDNKVTFVDETASIERAFGQEPFTSATGPSST